MTKTGEKFLERLAGVMEGKFARYNAYDVPAKSNEYAEIMKPCRQRINNILYAYQQGLMTENEAAERLALICTADCD